MRKHVAPKTVGKARSVLHGLATEHPFLSSFGFGYGYAVPAEKRVSWLEEQRKDMLSDASAEEFIRACSLFDSMKKEGGAIKTLTRNSYDLKHVFRGRIGYIRNGVFIAAAIHMGVPWARYDSANVLLGISKKWLKKQQAIDTSVARG